MRMATLPWKFSLAAAALIVAGTAALAQARPDTENGRYALSPTGDGGVLRLDTKTGTVSTCTNSGAGWACYAVPDERAALDAEIGRLQADNEKLKAQLAWKAKTRSFTAHFSLSSFMSLMQATSSCNSSTLT